VAATGDQTTDLKFCVKAEGKRDVTVTVPVKYFGVGAQSR
jgi:hypothetical protein